MADLPVGPWGTVRLGLGERLADLLDTVIPHLSPGTRGDLESLRAALREPVRVAVAGRVNAGKSTLVNALIGQRVAPTDVSECTTVVSWFRYGYPQRLELVLADGSRAEQQLTPGGRLPSELGVPVSEVDHLDVWLSSELLKSMTLIDTPGLGSLNAAYSESTESLLRADRASRYASSEADALVFLLNQETKSDELSAIRAFRESSGGMGGSAANAVGVLSKVDKLADGPEWSEIGQSFAKRLAQDLADDLATVVPVAGLLAETAAVAALRQADIDNLGHLAAMDPGELSMLLLSADEFVDGESTVPGEGRARLLALLDLQGVADAVDLVRDGTTGAGALRRALAGRSGIDHLRAVLLEGFRGHGEALKVRSALTTVEHLTYRATSSARDRSVLLRLRSEVERFRLDPDVHKVAELEALHACCTGQVALPDDLTDELRRLAQGIGLADRLGADGSDAASLERAAVEGVARFRTFSVGPAASPAARRIARVATRSYTLAWLEAGRVSGGAGSGGGDGVRRP